MTTDYPLSKVFTPSDAATIINFVEREESLTKRLYKVLRMRGRIVSVSGPTKSGKTTFVQCKLDQTYAAHIRYPCRPESTFHELVSVAFDRLGAHFQRGRTLLNRKSISKSVTAEFLKCGVTSTKEEKVEEEPIVRVQVTPDRLAEFLGAAECPLVIDDFHVMPREERIRVAGSLKAMLTVSSVDIDPPKIIIIGIPDSTQDLIKYGENLKGRLEAIPVPLMQSSQIRGIVEKGEQLLNVVFPIGLKEDVVHYSGGFAHVCHDLCHTLCMDSNVETWSHEQREVNPELLEDAVEAYLESTRLFNEEAYCRAMNTTVEGAPPNFAKHLLRGLAEFDLEGASVPALVKTLSARCPGFSESDIEQFLTVYVALLEHPDNGELIRLDSSRTEVSFYEPITMVYVRNLGHKQTGDRRKFLREFFKIMGPRGS